MNKEKFEKDLILLDESIAHWEEVKLGKEEPYSSQCPLCKEYNNETWELFAQNRCIDCPIFKDTDRTGCGGTNWSDAAEEYERGENDVTVDREEKLQYLKEGENDVTVEREKMLQYLKDLKYKLIKEKSFSISNGTEVLVGFIDYHYHPDKYFYKQDREERVFCTKPHYYKIEEVEVNEIKTYDFVCPKCYHINKIGFSAYGYVKCSSCERLLKIKGKKNERSK